MVTFDEAKQKIDQVISKINTYIETLIYDLINYRAIRTYGASKALAQYRTKILDNWALNYEQKVIYDKMATIRKGELAPATLTRPQLSFTYNADVGGLITLSTEEGSIDVPYVPRFGKVELNAEQFNVELSKEINKKAFKLIVYDTTNIAESPDSIRDYEAWKEYVYNLPVTNRLIETGSFNYPSPIKIKHLDVELDIKSLEYDVHIDADRVLTVNNEQKVMSITAWRGLFVADAHINGSTVETKIEGLDINVQFQLDRNCLVEIFGKQFALKKIADYDYRVRVFVLRTLKSYELYNVGAW